MNIKDIVKDNILPEVFKLISFYILGIFFNKVVLSNDMYSTLSIILPWIIYIFIILIVKMFKSPVLVFINITSYYSQATCINITHFHKYSEKERSLFVEIKVNKSFSLWNKVALRILEKTTIGLEITLSPNTGYFIISASNPLQDISKSKRGYLSLSITEMLKGALGNNNEFNQKIKFIINENRDNKPTNNQNFIIKPQIIVNDKPLVECNKLTKFMINYKTNLNMGGFNVQYYIDKE